MTEPRYVRTLIVPLGIAVIFLVLTPRLCQRMVEQASRRGPLPSPAAAATTPAPPARGLVIETTTPAAASSAPVRFPPGLDGARVEYLLEIDQLFAAPLVMPLKEESTITPLLLDKQYVEKRPNGTVVPTREGMLHLTGAAESSNGWQIPVAQRAFAGIAGIEDAGDGRFHVAVRWRWKLDPLFASLLQRPGDHETVAEFAGGEGHWVLARFVQEPDSVFR